MSDFSAEDLFDAVDREVQLLLESVGTDEPPVDAMELAQYAFRLVIRESDPDEESPRRPRANEVLIRADFSEEARQMACARGCARQLVPAVFKRLGVELGVENRGAMNQLIGLITPRLLLPSRWFARDDRKSGHDLIELKERYFTCGYELIALRWLDLEEPLVVAVIDDGMVSIRRGNRAPVNRNLTPAEAECSQRIGESGEPERVRRGDWTVHGWPIPNGPFNRIVLRAVPDEL